MEVIRSTIDPSSPQFAENAGHQRAMAEELTQRLEQVRQEGGPRYRKRHEEQGKRLECIFYSHAYTSAKGIPQIVVVIGSCTAN